MQRHRGKKLKILAHAIFLNDSDEQKWHINLKKGVDKNHLVEHIKLKCYSLKQLFQDQWLESH